MEVPVGSIDKASDTNPSGWLLFLLNLHMDSLMEGFLSADLWLRLYLSLLLLQKLFITSSYNGLQNSKFFSART